MLIVLLADGRVVFSANRPEDGVTGALRAYWGNVTRFCVLADSTGETELRRHLRGTVDRPAGTALLGGATLTVTNADAVTVFSGDTVDLPEP